MLKITCANCKASLQVPPNLAGKKIVCPKCKKPTLAAMAPVAIEPEEIEPELEEIVDEDEAFTPVPAKSPPKPAAKSAAKPPAKPAAKPKAPAKVTAKPPAKRSARDEDEDDYDEVDDDDEMDDSEEPETSRKGLWIRSRRRRRRPGDQAVAGFCILDDVGATQAPRRSDRRARQENRGRGQGEGPQDRSRKDPCAGRGDSQGDRAAARRRSEDGHAAGRCTASSNADASAEGEGRYGRRHAEAGASGRDAEDAAGRHEDPDQDAGRQTADRGGEGPDQDAAARSKTPSSTPPAHKATGDKTTVADLVFETVKVDAKDIVRSLTWTADGKSFYCLQSTGKLQRISNDDLMAFADVDLGERCTGMALSPEGLLVTAPASEQVLVVEPIALTVRRKISIPGLDRVAAGTKAPLAVALTKGGDVVLFDPKAAKIVHKYSIDELVQGAGSFPLVAMTPDGKYLFVETKSGKLHRLRVVDNTLVHEQATRPIASKTGRLDISPDGNYVCLSSETGNSETSMRTFVYQVEDMTTPEVILNAGPTPRAVGFDTSRGTIYAQSLKFALIAFSKTGAKLQQYELPGVGETRQIACSRTGELLVLTEDRLFRVRRDVK